MRLASIHLTAETIESRGSVEAPDLVVMPFVFRVREYTTLGSGDVAPVDGWRLIGLDRDE